jgi:hypothetical protein
MQDIITAEQPAVNEERDFNSVWLVREYVGRKINAVIRYDSDPNGLYHSKPMGVITCFSGNVDDLGKGIHTDQGTIWLRSGRMVCQKSTGLYPCTQLRVATTH